MTVKNSQSGTNAHEGSDGIYRNNTPVPVRINVPPQDSAMAMPCPCIDCICACTCQDTGNSCKAFKAYVQTGKWEGSEQGMNVR
jgi:hypothetical protein